MASNANTELKKTRSGITPDTTELPFSISTSDVESYLQAKVDAVENRSAKMKGSDVEHFNVKVYTTEAGRNFLPFVVVLPIEVLESRQKKKQAKTPSIFNPKESDGTATMRPELYKLFSSYVYNKEDEQAFFSEDWRRSRGVNRETSPVLKSLRTPKVTSIDNGRLQVVSFMLDPLRVFHDMLIMEENNSSFKVDVFDWKKKQAGEFAYKVKRLIDNGKGKKYKQTVADELNRKMRAGR